MKIQPAYIYIYTQPKTDQSSCLQLFFARFGFGSDYTSSWIVLIFYLGQYQPRHEKTCPWGFSTGPKQTRQGCTARSLKFLIKEVDGVYYVAKNKGTDKRLSRSCYAPLYSHMQKHVFT